MRFTSGVRLVFLSGAMFVRIMSIGLALGLLICAAGMFPCSVVVAQAETQEEELEEKDAFYLEEMVVTGTKTEYLLKDVTTVITEKEIEAANVDDIAEMLRLVPCISQRKSYSPLIHGQPALVLIDGQMAYTGGCPGRGRVAELDHFAIDSVERIEIITGGQAVLYGEDALGGVINIITKSPPVGKPTFSASTSFAELDTQVHTLSHGYKPGKFGYNFGYLQKATDGMNRLTDRREYEEVWAKLEYDFSDISKLTLSPKHYTRDAFRNGVSDPYDNYMFNVSYSLKPDDISNLNLSSSIMERAYNKSRTKKRKETKIVYDRKFFDSHTLTGGYHFAEDRSYDKTLDDHGIFFHDAIEFGPFIATLGARHDEHSKYGGYFSPSSGLFYRVNNDLSLKASIGKGIRYNTFRATYSTEEWTYKSSGGGSWTYRPFDLLPECLMSYQLSAEYRILENLMSKVSVFRNNSEDKVQKVDTGTVITRDGKTGALYEYKNIAKVYTQGMDIEFSTQLAENLLGSIGWSFLDTEDKETGKELTQRPKHQANIWLNRRFPDIGLSANLIYRYVGHKFRDSANTHELPDYHIVDFDISKDITEYAKVTFSVDNLLDKDTSYSYSGYHGGTSTSTPEPGRVCKVEVKVTF